jgi:hypothetical protein
MLSYAIPLLKKLGHEGEDVAAAFNTQMGLWVARNGALSPPPAGSSPDPVKYWLGVALHVPNMPFFTNALLFYIHMVKL